jgi:hypothetical protein
MPLPLWVLKTDSEELFELKGALHGAPFLLKEIIIINVQFNAILES